MTERQLNWAMVITVATMIFIFWLLFSGKAKAEDCPPGAKSCKVVVITAEEEQTLTTQVFPAALWANRTFTDLIEAWKNKIAAAPAGSVKAAPTKVEPKK